MESSSQQSAVALLGLWMFFLVMGSVLLVGGCIYALYCLGRMASNLERLANGVELMLSRDAAKAASALKAARSGDPVPGAAQPVLAVPGESV